MAAVDVGSTSVHLLVAHVDRHVIRPLADDSVLLGLGGRVEETGYLGASTRAGLAAVLADDAVRARALGADPVVFIATEPLRRAADAARAVVEVERESGVALHVLSQVEEAWLTLIGVTGGRPVTARLSVVDVGGGSTELVMAEPGRPVEVRGLPVGAARLLAEIVHADPPRPAELAQLRATARRQLAAIPTLGGAEIVAVGGTASNLLKIVAGGRVDRRLTRARLAEAFELLGRERSDVLAPRYGLREIRARLLPAGAAILEALLELGGAEEISVSEAGIREGAVLAASHDPIAWRDRLARLALGWPG
ncbi:MAG: hypothetical protein ACOYXS_00435 [Chloroflexota bacterium]